MRLLFQLAPLGVAFTLLSCSSGSPSCENDVLDDIPSPSGLSSAVVFSRNCGATTGYNIQVSILPKGTTPNGKGNALVIDHVPVYSPIYRPIWQNDRKVVLSIPTGARVFLKSTVVNATEVSFSSI